MPWVTDHVFGDEYWDSGDSPVPGQARIIESPEYGDAYCVEHPAETYRLALESAQRWLGRYRLSPAMRLRAVRAVIDAALSDGS